MGALLGAAAFVLFALQAGAFYSALAGALVEIIMGAALFVRYRNNRVRHNTTVLDHIPAE